MVMPPSIVTLSKGWWVLPFPALLACAAFDAKAGPEEQRDVCPSLSTVLLY